MKFESKQVRLEKRFKDVNFFGNVRDWVYVKPLPRLQAIDVECSHCKKHTWGIANAEFPISFEEQYYALALVSMCEEQAYPRGTKTKNGELEGVRRSTRLLRDIATVIERLDGKFTPDDLAREWAVLDKKYKLTGPKFKFVP